MSNTPESKSIRHSIPFLVNAIVNTDLQLFCEDLLDVHLIAQDALDQLDLLPNRTKSEKAGDILSCVLTAIRNNPKVAFPKFLEILRKHFGASRLLSAVEFRYSENGGNFSRIWKTPVSHETSSPQDIFQSIALKAGIGVCHLEQYPDYCRLKDISCQLGAQWEICATKLELSPKDVENIKFKYDEVTEQAFEALALWKVKSSFTPKYKRLVEIFVSLNLIDLAHFVCQLIAKTFII